MSTELIFIQTKLGNQKFKVDRKIIDTSLLLKNICDLTKITEPIIINCNSQSLDIFIQLISHYEIINMDYHDTEFEKVHYFDNFGNDEKLFIAFIKDLCILDSDFFLDSIADFILEKMEEMDWRQMKKYLGLEDDFTVEDRKMINENSMEYFYQ